VHTDIAPRGISANGSCAACREFVTKAWLLCGYSHCLNQVNAAAFCSMARKKAKQNQETTLVPHRTPNLSALLERANDGASAQAVRAYINAGGSPVALIGLQGARHLLQLPLLHYMAFIHTECVQLLVAAGTDINARFTDPDGLVSTAVQADSTAEAELLLQYGADMTITDKLGQNGLFSAAALGLVHMLELFVKRGLDVHALDARDFTVLMVAASQGRTAATEWLIAKALPINAANHSGHTANACSTEWTCQYD
jgi:hypothetical protein